MRRNGILCASVLAVFLCEVPSVAMPGQSDDETSLGDSFSEDVQAVFRAQFEELGVHRRAPSQRQHAYRRSFSAADIEVPERPSEARSPTFHRKQLKRGITQHFADTESENLFELTTGLFASQINSHLSTFLREPCEEKSRFFEVLRKEKFIQKHRFGRFVDLHTRFDKIILDAFIKGMDIDDARRASAQIAREIYVKLQKTTINDDTETAFSRLLELTLQKIDESELELSLRDSRFFARQILANAFVLYFIGPTVLESGDREKVEPMRALMSTMAYSPDVVTHLGSAEKEHWNAWIEVINYLLGSE